MTLKRRSSKNILGKVKNAGNQHFLLFSECFLDFSGQCPKFEPHLACCLLIPLNPFPNTPF